MKVLLFLILAGALLASIGLFAFIATAFVTIVVTKKLYHLVRRT